MHTSHYLRSCSDPLKSDAMYYPADEKVVNIWNTRMIEFGRSKAEQTRKLKTVMQIPCKETRTNINIINWRNHVGIDQSLWRENVKKKKQIAPNQTIQLKQFMCRNSQVTQRIAIEEIKQLLLNTLKRPHRSGILWETCDIFKKEQFWIKIKDKYYAISDLSGSSEHRRLWSAANAQENAPLWMDRIAIFGIECIPACA